MVTHCPFVTCPSALTSEGVLESAAAAGGLMAPLLPPSLPRGVQPCGESQQESNTHS